jgi:hypothetical protein
MPGIARFFLAGFAGLPEIEKDGKIFYCRLDRFVELDPEFIQLYILQDFGRPPVVVPEAGA